MKSKKSIKQVPNADTESLWKFFMDMNCGAYLAKVILDKKGMPCDYRYIEVNLLFEQIISLSRDQIIGKTYNELVPPDPASGWPDCFIRVARTSVPDSYIFYSTVYDRYFETYAFMVREDIFAVLVTDITGRKQAELEREQFYRFFNISSDLMAIAGPDGRFIKINPSGMQLLQYAEKELSGMLFIDFVHPDDRQSTIREVEKILKHNASVGFENRFLCSNGSFIWLSWNTIYSEEENLVFSTARNITERKHIEEELREHEEHLEEIVAERTLKLDEINDDLKNQIRERMVIEQELIAAKEKAEESDRLKSVFLANMSHEVRTPMNAIIGFAEFLSLPDLTEDKKIRFTGFIQQRAYDLLRILEDILDVSKIEAGQMTFVEEELNLFELFMDINAYYQQKLLRTEKKSKITLLHILPGNLKKVMIKSDKQRLKQVLTNLLDNAVKFTHQGSIEFGCESRPDSTLIFYVKDTGIGIPAEKFSLIFDRFRQADDTGTARNYGGTGLGLSIVKGIVNLMKGTIWVESEEGKGTTFFFSVPIIYSKSADTEMLPQNSNIKQAWQNKTILIVEDDKANAAYLKELLVKTGVNLFYASSGHETLEILKNHTEINLILMDILLPDTNGLILTKTIRKNHPEIKIIAQTAYATRNDKLKCIGAGCNDYISKPIDRNKLFSKINKLLK